MRRGNFRGDQDPLDPHWTPDLTERRLNAYSRFFAALVAAVGVVGGLATLDWRWPVGGAVVALLVVLGGPWHTVETSFTRVEQDPNWKPDLGDGEVHL